MSETAIQLDFKGLCCPLPLLKLKQALRGVPPGSLYHVMTTDPGSRLDIAAWCKAAGHRLLELRTPDDTDASHGMPAEIYAFTIRTGGH